MKRALLIGVAIGITPFLVLVLDRRIAEFVALNVDSVGAVATTISAVGGPGVLLTFLGALCLVGCLKRWFASRFGNAQSRPGSWLPIFLVAAGTTLVSLMTKSIIGRARPLKSDFDPLLFAPLHVVEGYGSFPSAQAALAAALAVMLSHRFPRYRAAVLAVAATLCLARIGTAEHWVSDVWLGVLLGIGAGSLYISIERRQMAHLVLFRAKRART